MSGGQEQRVALARALVRRAPITLLDEPMSQLEPQLRLPLGHVATEGRHGLADHAQVEVEADAGDVPGLLAAEHVARTANL